MREMDIGYLIKSVDEKLKIRADADLKKHNLTMAQSTVLLFLYAHENNQSTQKEIEEFLDISHPAVVGIVSRMEQNHHVITWMDQDNRRNKIVRLTPEAQSLGETMNQMRQAWEDKMLQDFSSEDAEQLKQWLWKVNQNLS